MDQEIKDQIMSFLAKQDLKIVQQGCILFAQHVRTEQELCDLFSIQIEQGFSPIADVILTWSQPVLIYNWLSEFGDLHQIGLIQNRQRNYQIQFVTPRNHTCQFALLSQEGFEFWKNSSIDLDEYIERFDGDEEATGFEDVPSEFDFCTKDNVTLWKENWKTAVCFEYENFYIKIVEKINHTEVNSLYEGLIFDLVKHGTILPDYPIKVREIPEPDTTIQLDDTFRIFCLGHWRSGDDDGFYLDISITNEFDFSKLIIHPAFDNYHGKLLLYRESIQYDDPKCENLKIELHETILESNDWVCTRRDALYENILESKKQNKVSLEKPTISLKLHRKRT